MRGNQTMEHLPKIFRTSSTYPYPVYVLKDGKLFRTIFHPNGWSDNPDYELGNDGKFYRTEYHELGINLKPDYEFGKEKKICRTLNHPNKDINIPEYEIRD